MGGLGSTASQLFGFFSSSFMVSHLGTSIRMQKNIIHLPQKVCRRFVGNVNFFLSPCVRLSDMVQFSVACYTFKQEVTFLNYPYGYLLRVLHWCTDQSMTAALETMDLTASQGHIMAYLAHQSQPPCPRDIEAEFQLSHPTVSGLLSRMEQKGFIELRTDPDDRRCKRIYVLDKGWQCHELMHQIIDEREKRIVEGFTPEEQAQFSDLLQRAITNMGGSPCRRNPKEEDNE